MVGVVLQRFIEELQNVYSLRVLHLLLAVELHYLNFKFYLVWELLRVQLGLTLVDEPVPFFRAHHHLVELEGVGDRSLDFRDQFGGATLQVERATVDSH